LSNRSHRWFVTGGGRVRTLLVSVRREDKPIAWNEFARLAETAGLALNQHEIYVIDSTARNGQFASAASRRVTAPDPARSDYPELVREAKLLTARIVDIPHSVSHGALQAAKVGRNDPCWCGSGSKYKRCHGR
jgi:hypothetical protein